MAGENNNHAPKPVQVTGPALLIVLDPMSDSVTVSDSTGSEILALGMLEKAKLAVRLAAEQRKSSIVQVPPGSRIQA
jgi:hypothetical protein